MAYRSFDQPILNSPYEIPAQHWELDDNGQPTQEISPRRRPADFITPIPKPRKGQKGTPSTTETVIQSQLDIFGLNELSEGGQNYDPTSRIGQVRTAVDSWFITFTATIRSRTVSYPSQTVAWPPDPIPSLSSYLPIRSNMVDTLLRQKSTQSIGAIYLLDYFRRITSSLQSKWTE